MVLSISKICKKPTLAAGIKNGSFKKATLLEDKIQRLKLEDAESLAVQAFEVLVILMYTPLKLTVRPWK